MIEWTAQDLESAKDVLLTADIGYWVSEARTLEDGSLRLLEDTDDDTDAVTISPARLLEWLASDAPRALISELGAQYQKAAVAGLMARDWNEVDYDVDTADYIVQYIALGEIRYS